MISHKQSPTVDYGMTRGIPLGSPKSIRRMFSVIQYSPNLSRGEVINIGIAVHDCEEPELVSIRFTEDWSRVLALDPQADMAMLRCLEQEWQHEQAPLSEKIQTLLNSASGCVQLTPPRASLGGDITTYLKQMMNMYVPTLDRSLLDCAERTPLYKTMKSFLERRGLWQQMTKDLPASHYAHPGNPLRIDCTYKTVRSLHCIHAVDLSSQNHDASLLASSASSLRTGVLRTEGLELELFAIVESRDEDWSSQELNRYLFVLETMTQAGISVLPLVDIRQIESHMLSAVA